MRILHFSDLHFGDKYRNKILRMFPSFLKKIEEINGVNKIDIVLFTGDLVWSGNKLEDFDEAKRVIIEPILQKLSLTKEMFIFCPGNHDMSSEKEMEAITDYVNKISNNDKLDDFIQDKDQFELSYKNSDNYFSFSSKYYESDNIEKLFHSFQRKFNEHKIGIVSFHTPWRSFIGNHSGQLLIPQKIINDALRAIPNNDLYLSLMHHPISDLKNFNSYEIEDLIYEKFHINFSGHYHKKKQEIVVANDIGMLSISSMASMSGNDDSSIGFSIVDIDIDTYDIIISNFSYIKSDNIFTELPKVYPKLPMNEEKTKQVNLIKRIKDLYEATLYEANLLLINYEDSEEKAFLHFFNEPILKKKSYYEAIKEKGSADKIKIVELIESNNIIYGKDKYGKTSLLRKIQLDVIDNFISKNIIPLYFDLKNLQSTDDFNLTKELKSIFHLTNKNIEKLICENKFKILLDNFNHNNSLHVDLISKLSKKIQNLFITLTAEESEASILSNLILDDIEFEKVFIHPISRKGISNQISKMLNDYDSERQNEIKRKISLIFNQMNIPFNYWYLSLFLWIYKKQKNISISDNVEMLTLYVDKLLEREKIASFNKNIDYELFKKMLGELSYILLTKYNMDNYTLKYADLVNFIENFRNENIRFVTDTKEIIDYLINKGIIKKKPNSKYTFRLNGVMEYFTAIYMNDNRDFVDVVLNDSEYFLEFANEIEIFAGLDRKNLDLLNKLYSKTKQVMNSLNNKYLDNPDIELKDKLMHSKELVNYLLDIEIEKQLPIEVEKQDELLDNVDPVQGFNEDVKIKKALRSNEGFTLDQLAKHVFILSRAFRSLTLIKDIDLMNKTFDLIISSYINLGFEIINEIDLDKDKPKKELEKKILQIISSFIPLVTQLLISDAVLHKNLDRFIKEKIEKLEKDMKNNQYELMILYFMLLDIDINSNSSYINNIEKNINILSLKNISVIKLLHFLMFFSNGKKELESLLKKSIANLQKKLNPSEKKSKLINNIEKELILRKRFEKN